MLKIRRETPADYAVVEEITRQAFYNIYMPGCVVHYLVHIMRTHTDFIPELALVLELDGEIVGNVMYTKARLVAAAGAEKQIVTFGPVCVRPDLQRRGYGKKLLAYSFDLAAQMGYEAIVIFGSPVNYVGLGFQSCARYSISVENGQYPAAMLVKELKPGALSGESWVYHDSPIMNIDEAAAQAYDDTLPKMARRHTPSQEEFYIMSNSFIQK